MANHPLTTALNRLRQRVLAVGGTAGVLWMLVGAMLCLALGVWLDLLFDLSPQWRLAILISAGVAACALLMYQLQLVFADGHASTLARRLDAAAGTGGQILCGVDLLAAQSMAAHSLQPELTAGLASLAVNRAANLASGIPSRNVVSAQPLRRSAAALVGLALLGTLAAWLMPRLAATEWNRFLDPFGDHPPFSTVEFQIEPGDTQIVYGSGLEIRATAVGGRVDNVELVLQPADGSAEDVLPMFPEPGGPWRATIANLVQPLDYSVRSRGVRSRKFRVDLITVPRIEDVTFQITPPAYTRIAATEGPLPVGGLAGLPGTKVRAAALSNRPLSGGTLSYFTAAGQNDVVLKPGDAADTATGEFTLAAAGRIEIHVADVDRQSSTSPFTAAVTLLADERPFVRLLEPRPVSFAVPTAVMPVVIAAEDDYGISRLQLFRNLNDSTFLPADLPLPAATARTAYQVVPLPLGEYRVEPGDEIKLFARVEDNDPSVAATDGEQRAAGKGSESAVVTIRIISQEEFDQLRQTREGLEALLSKYQQVRRRLESVAEELEQLGKETSDQPNEEAASEELRRELQKLAEKMEQEADALRKLREERQNFKLDEELAKELQRQEEALQRLAKQTEALAGNAQARNEDLKRELERMRNELAGERERLDQEMSQPLEKLAQIFPLKQDEAKFVQLYERQRDLANRLASLKDQERADDPALKARMRDLEAEQRQLHAALEELISDIEDHVAQLPDDEELDNLRESAAKFAKELRESGAVDAMSEAETGLAEFSGQRGHDGAKAAADILEKFLGQCEGMGNEAGMCLRFQPGMNSALQQTMNQLLQNMGLGQGMGGGQGGYSTRQSTMDNVGLYGNSPALGDAARQGNGNRTQDRAGRNRGQGGGVDGETTDAGRSLDEPLRPAGGAEAAVPLRYRRQVGRYFQRIADEVGDR